MAFELSGYIQIWQKNNLANYQIKFTVTATVTIMMTVTRPTRGHVGHKCQICSDDSKLDEQTLL